MSIRRQSVVGVAVLMVFAATAIAQQPAAPLTLSQAVAIAVQKNPQRKVALAQARVATENVATARSFLLPHLDFSETATRGNDPVYVFGNELRQRRFTAADFALNKLNTPAPFGNFSTRFSGSWTLFDSFASWHGVVRAREMSKAEQHELDRADQQIVFQVVRSYYEVLLSAKRVSVAEQSEATAKAILARSQDRFESGLVVESDLLTAKVRLASRQQDTIRARNNLGIAKSQLNTAMGMPVDSSFEIPEALAERALPIPQLEEAEKQALDSRPDLKRIASEQAAQLQSVSVAKAAFGPQVNAFAGCEMDNPTFLAGGGGNNWVGGVELRIDIFNGGAKRAELSRQRALKDKAEAMRQAATDAARLEVRRAYYELDSNRQQIDVARAAIAQAQESLRIDQDRYDGGLTTMADLLSVEETARRTQTDYWETVYNFHVSYAALELATGLLNQQSPVVMP